MKEWEQPTYQPWREKLHHFCDLRDAEKQITEGFEKLEASGVTLPHTKTLILNIVGGLRETAYKEHVEAFNAHVDAVMAYHAEQKEEPAVWHGAEVAE